MSIREDCNFDIYEIEELIEIKMRNKKMRLKLNKIKNNLKKND